MRRQSAPINTEPAMHAATALVPITLAALATGYAAVCLAIACRFTTARRCAPKAFDGQAEQVSFAARDALAR